jgi:hypothetical protein
VRQLQADGLADEVAGAYHVPDVSLELYLGRAPRRAPTLRALHDALAEIPAGIWIVPTSRLDSLRADPACAVEPVRLGPRRSAVRIRLKGTATLRSASSIPGFADGKVAVPIVGGP